MKFGIPFQFSAPLVPYLWGKVHSFSFLCVYLQGEWEDKRWGERKWGEGCGQTVRIWVSTVNLHFFIQFKHKEYFCFCCSLKLSVCSFFCLSLECFGVGVSCHRQWIPRICLIQFEGHCVQVMGITNCICQWHSGKKVFWWWLMPVSVKLGFKSEIRVISHSQEKLKIP